MAELIGDFDKLFTVNTKITLVVPDGDYAGNYDSRVEDFDRDGSILAAMPSSGGIPVPLIPGTKAEVSFMGPDSRYMFATSVLGRVKTGSIYFLKLKKPEQVERNQLRDFFRVSTRIKGSIALFHPLAPGEKTSMAYDSRDCMVVDISGGGCRLISEAEAAKGQHVSVDLSEILGRGSVIHGRVIRTVRLEGKNQISVEFSFKKESERNPLVKYVFKRQIELKQIRG
ncbi:MAG: flagellar brake protein [Geovibrio sp.]|jgi:c-di-GMP-binding flagellar brake protein YcgR|uniref:flagellar brake protein n=1 Tax=Geovibrio ferrireducens TaxID=46201 RepID=UPI0022460226|nr:flagellar brake protein [Geovibrio ferrireducens]MCD8492901.1 flagellar brake protein [Geovibrio sp.]MCD8567564.1 flagellar brake protein [Geovibrio sp.]